METKDNGDNIMMVDSLERKPMNYYYVPLACVNCQSCFTEHEPFSSREYPAVCIKRGVKIADIKCPVCGCYTLRSMQ